MLKRYEITKSDAETILEHDKQNARALARLSKACLGLGRIADAIKHADVACVLEPTSQPLRQDLARLQQLQTELKRGEDKLEAGDAGAATMAARRCQALANGVSSGMTLVAAELLLARALLRSGRGQEALTVSRTAVSADSASSSSSAMAVHAEALVATGATMHTSACAC